MTKEFQLYSKVFEVNHTFYLKEVGGKNCIRVRLDDEPWTWLVSKDGKIEKDPLIIDDERDFEDACREWLKILEEITLQDYA